MEYGEGRGTEAHKLIDGVLAKVPNYAPALLVKARFFVAKRKLER